MDDQKRKSRAAIIAEAIGERDPGATPEPARDKAQNPPEEAVRQGAQPSGSRETTADIAAEAVGERVGDAYPHTPRQKAGKRRGKAVRPAAAEGMAGDILAAGQGAARTISRGFAEQPLTRQPLLTMLAGFALGYAAAVLIHRRR